MRMSGWFGILILILIIAALLTSCAHIDHEHPHDHIYIKRKLLKPVDECKWYFDPNIEEYVCL